MVSLTGIINQVAEFYGIGNDELLHGDRRRNFSEPRHVAMYLCHRLLGMTQETIGISFAKNRTLALYAIKKIAECVADPRYNRRAAECIKTILWNLKNDRNEHQSKQRIKRKPVRQDKRLAGEWEGH